MTIPAALEAQILRYFHVEKWRVGTIPLCQDRCRLPLGAFV